MSSIRLDVGGTIFTTTKSTLTKFDGMLKALCTTELGLTQQPDSSVFIDRDPTHFRKILNYLRDGDVILPESPEAVQELRKEAEYYCLDGLVDICTNRKSNAKRKPPLREDEFWFVIGGKLFYANYKEVKKCGGLLKQKFEEQQTFYLREISRKKSCDRVLFEIDRDPTYFVHILAYIKNGFLHPIGRTALPRVLEDAQFYGLNYVASYCKQEMTIMAMFDQQQVPRRVVAGNIDQGNH